MVLLPLLSVLLYLPSLNHGFILDDRWLVVENPYVKSWAYLPQMLARDLWNVWDHHNYWRPVLALSFALDFSLWGLNPFGFHLTNILLHAVNVTALYLLATKLQGRSCALFAALLFALHPIQAQAVNLVSSRGDLLAAFFTLLSVHSLFLGRTALSLVLLVPALLSKETSMVLPAVFFGVLLIKENKRDRKILGAFAILALYLVIRFSLGFTFSLPQSPFSYEASLPTRILLAFKVLALYFRALLNPLEVAHPFWSVEVPRSLTDFHVLSGVLVLGLLLGAIYWSWRKNPVAGLGLVWFLIYFVPISNLKQLNQPMAEHWLYVPMIGLSLSFGAAWDAAYKRLSELPFLRGAGVAAVGVLLASHALAASEKTKIYRNDESFWLAVTRANPHLARAYSILGTIHLSREEISLAREFYAKALALDPEEFVANYRMGYLLQRAGQREESKSFLLKVVRSEPSALYAILTVADAWEMLGDREKALHYYRKALALHPGAIPIQRKITALVSRPPPES